MNIQAEKKPVKKPPTIPTSMSEGQGMKYVEEQCQILFKSTTYDTEEVQQALKNVDQMYFNYKQFRLKVANLLVKLKMPG